MSKLSLDISRLSSRCFLYIWNFFRGFTGIQCYIQECLILLKMKIFLFGLKKLSFPRGLNSQLVPFFMLVNLIPCYLEAALMYLIMKILLKLRDLCKNCGVSFSANVYQKLHTPNFSNLTTAGLQVFTVGSQFPISSPDFFECLLPNSMFVSLLFLHL